LEATSQKAKPTVVLRGRSLRVTHDTDTFHFCTKNACLPLLELLIGFHCRYVVASGYLGRCSRRIRFSHMHELHPFFGCVFKANRCLVVPQSRARHGNALRVACYLGTLAYYGNIVPAHLQGIRCFRLHRMHAITGSDAQALWGL
jgi:hypothetical protein